MIQVPNVWFISLFYRRMKDQSYAGSAASFVVSSARQVCVPGTLLTILSYTPKDSKECISVGINEPVCIG